MIVVRNIYSYLFMLIWNEVKHLLALAMKTSIKVTKLMSALICTVPGTALYTRLTTQPTPHELSFQLTGTTDLYCST